MAAHANRSPSPLSSRSINPNPRNSENNPTIRRSFSGHNHNPFAKPSALTNQRRLDPITPANSPSEFARRRSVVREGKDCEEKENDERECVLRASKLQSSPAKGCKNFMAPTISAASKFTPSPRKKVLVERNDPVRTSISLSEGKAMFFSDVCQDLEPKSEIEIGSNLADLENKKAAAVLDSHPVSRPCKKVTFSEIPCDSHRHSTESVLTDDSDSLKLEESKVAAASSIAPLDADPSLPPYDPKTNYLSPRPQFIRYKPNPRVEMLLNKEKLEDSLMAEIMSEGFSDSDVSSKEEIEIAASSDMVIGVDEEIEAEDADADASELPRSELLPVSTTPVDQSSEEEFVQNNNGKRKTRSLSRMMCFSAILILLLACGSVPSFDEVFIKDLSMSDLRSSFYEQSRAAVDSARLRFGSSVALILKLANEMVEAEKKQVVPFQFVNLTDLQENTWKKEFFLKRVEIVEEDEFEEEEMEEAFEHEEYADAETDTFEEEEEEEAYAEGDYDDVFPQEDVVAAAEESEIQTENLALVKLSEPNSADQSAAATAAQNQESEGEVKAAAEEVAVDEKSLEAHIFNLGTSSDNGDTISSEQTAEEGLMGRHAAAITSSLFAGVVGAAAAAALILYYMKKNPTSSSVVGVEKTMMSRSSKQTEYAKTTKPPMMNQQQEREISESWETESEMSSSSYYHQSGINEVGSSERKTMGRKYTKRESLASSSGYSAGGSPSYGSFTTYERIPAKTNSYGDEEIVTPVRRSSRIRKNQVSSP